MPFALPPELTWPSLLIIVVAVTLAYLVFGATGFGSSVIAVPVVAHFLPLTFVVPLITAVDLGAVSNAMVRLWRLVAWREFLRLLGPAFIGIVVGSTILINLPRNVALVALGIFVIAFALHTLAGARQWHAVRTAWSIPSGLFGGIFSALFGTGGPVYMAYLASRIDDKTVLRATSSMTIAAVVVMRAIAFLFTALWLQPGMLLMVVLLVPGMLVGYAVGSHLHLRLSPIAARRWIAWLLLANGAILIVRALGLVR